MTKVSATEMTKRNYTHFVKSFLGAFALVSLVVSVSVEQSLAETRGHKVAPPGVSDRVIDSELDYFLRQGSLQTMQSRPDQTEFRARTADLPKSRTSADPNLRGNDDPSATEARGSCNEECRKGSNLLGLNTGITEDELADFGFQDVAIFGEDTRKSESSRLTPEEEIKFRGIGALSCKNQVVGRRRY